MADKIIVKSLSSKEQNLKYERYTPIGKSLNNSLLILESSKVCLKMI